MGLNRGTLTTGSFLTAMAARRGGGTLLTVTTTLHTGDRAVVLRGGGSLRGNGTTNLGSNLLSELVLGRTEVGSVTLTTRGITSLPSPYNELLSRVGEPGNLSVGGVSIPVNIVNVVCRTHPGIAISTTKLYLGDSGTIVLHNNGRTVGSGVTLTSIVHATVRSYNFSGGYVRLMASVSHRSTGRVVAVGNCVSYLVPHNNGKLVEDIIHGSAIPIVRANSKGYRVCISRDTSVRVTTGVVFGTGARHVNIYGTYRDLIVRSNVVGGTLPTVGTELSAGGIRVHNSRHTVVTTGNILPTDSRSFTRRCLSCVVDIGAISDLSRTVERVGGCSAGRDRTVVARGGTGTSRFLTEVSSSSICIGTSAEFASNNRFNLDTRVNVSARGLRTENPVNLQRLAAAGCLVCNGNRIHWNWEGFGKWMWRANFGCGDFYGERLFIGTTSLSARFLLRPHCNGKKFQQHRFGSGYNWCSYTSDCPNNWFHDTSLYT